MIIQPQMNTNIQGYGLKFSLTSEYNSQEKCHFHESEIKNCNRSETCFSLTHGVQDIGTNQVTYLVS